MPDAAATSPARELLLLGLPHTGKTTFLALLYLALTEGRGTNLRLAQWAGDFDYLNQIANDLMGGTEAVHTPHDDHRRQLGMPLQSPDGAVFDLQVPDLSGERWRDAVDGRHWDVEIEQLVVTASAKLVFVHPDEIVDGPTINEVQAGARALGAQDDPRPGAGTHGDLSGGPPTQVQLVDLIQLTCEQRGSRPTRLCLVVSAWDQVVGKPGDFLARDLPLLQQYLEVNADWLDWRVYGVSAQGGRFDDGDTRDELLARDAIDRSIVEAADGTEGEIGDLLEWALGLS